MFDCTHDTLSHWNMKALDRFLYKRQFLTLKMTPFAHTENPFTHVITAVVYVFFLKVPAADPWWPEAYAEWGVRDVI